jgi:hypothetical protein
VDILTPHFKIEIKNKMNINEFSEVKANNQIQALLDLITDLASNVQDNRNLIKLLKIKIKTLENLTDINQLKIECADCQEGE